MHQEEPSIPDREYSIDPSHRQPYRHEDGAYAFDVDVTSARGKRGHFEVDGCGVAVSDWNDLMAHFWITSDLDWFY